MKKGIFSRAISFILAMIMVVLMLPIGLITIGAAPSFSYTKTGDVFTVAGKKYYKATTLEDFNGVGSGSEFWLTESNGIVTDYDTLEKLERLDIYADDDWLNNVGGTVAGHADAARKYFEAFKAIGNLNAIGDAVGFINGALINITEVFGGNVYALKDIVLDMTTYGSGIKPKDIQQKAYMFVLQSYVNNCCAYAKKYENIKAAAHTDYETFEEAMLCWAHCSAAMDVVEYLVGSTVREYAENSQWGIVKDYLNSVFFDLAKAALPDSDAAKIIEKVVSGVMDFLPIADLALHSDSKLVYDANVANIRLRAMPTINVSTEQETAKQLANGVSSDESSSGGSSVSEDAFAQKIEALKKQYPHGKYWNQYNGVDSEGIAKAGDKPCTGTSNKTGKKCTVYGYCAYGGSCTCKCGYYKGWQCFGFANLMAYKVFGSYATTNYKSSGVNKSAGWKYYTSVSSYYAGDVVRINGNHSIFITKVTSSTVYYVDCNNYHKGAPCQISWDNKISVSSLKSQTTFVVRMTNNDLKGSSVATPVLTIKFNANGGSVADVYKITTNGAGLWLRSSADASISTNKLLVIPDSTIITASERKSAGGYTWIKTSYNNVSGWCAVSGGLAERTGYYLNDSIVYKRDTSAVYTQKWKYGEGGVNGLVNRSTLKLTKEGYNFVGWSLSPDGSTTVFDQNDTSLKAESICPDVKSGNKTVVLYAVWAEDENVSYTHSFSFDANGGDGEMPSMTVKSNETLELPENTFTYDEKRFEGWYVKRNNDGKWLTENGGWATTEEVDEYVERRRLVFEYEIYTIDSSWRDGVSGDCSYTLYSKWLDASVRAVNIISITNKPYYYVGEQFDTTGLSVLVERENGGYEIITEGFTYTPKVFKEEGDQYVLIVYEGASAVVPVKVTSAKTRAVNGKAKVNSVGYLLPSKSAPTICDQGAWKDDTLQVLCRDGDFYLCFIPWGATEVTDANGVLVYLPVEDVMITDSDFFSDSYDYYSLGVEVEANARFNASAYLYHRPDGGAVDVKYNGELYTKVGPFAKDTEIRVLFEMNGYYCVQTEESVGFVEKSLVDLDPFTISLSWEWEGVETPVIGFTGGWIDIEGLKVYKDLSDGTRVEIDNASIYAPGTDMVGDNYIWINDDIFVTVVPVKIKEPEIIGVSINQKPYKMSYILNEEFDPSGLELLVQYDNGNTEIIDEGIELHYEFDELGSEDVEITYNGVTTWLTVKVYEKPTVEIIDTVGYEGQTLTVPVGYFAGEGQELSVTSFDANVVYNNELLIFSGFRPLSGIAATDISVTENGVGVVSIKYSSEQPLPADCVLVELYFNVSNAGVEEDSVSEIYLENINISDSESFIFDADVENGMLTYMGEITVAFEGDEEGLPEALRAKYGEKITVPEMTGTKSGYEFLGWASILHGSVVEYVEGDVIVCVEDMTLYPVWEEVKSGDVNGDGGITNADVLGIYRYIYNSELYPLDLEVADVNGDGSVTNADVLAIYRYIYDPELYPLG